MASKKISQLPTGTNLSAVDQFAIARGGSNYYITGQMIIDAATFDPTAINNAITALETTRLKLDASNGPMTGTLVMSGAGNQFQNPNAPSAGNDLTNKTYVDTMVPLAGGTMSGLLILSGNAVAALGAVTLQQLNAAVAGITPPADTNDLPEGSDGSAAGTPGAETDGNRYYYTNARWDARWTTKDTDDLPEGSTNYYFTQTRFDTSFALKTTDNLTEGVTNLYFTNARARLAISATAPITYNNATGVIGFSGTSPTYGAVDQIPFTNATTNDFDYSANLKYDGTRLVAFDGSSSVIIGDTTVAGAFSGGTGSVIIGKGAGLSMVNSDGNIFIGIDAGKKELGGTNVYIGKQTGAGITSGTTTNTENTFVGFRVASPLDGGSSNTGVGSASLSALTSGDDNIAIGKEAGNNLTTGSGNIYIGSVAASAVGASNELRIGKGAVLPLSANLSTGAVTINSAFTLPTADGGANTILKTDGAGTVTWAAAATGTVTSIATSGTVNGLTLTGGPITTTGTITLGGTLAINNGDWSGTDLSVANGGTGASAFTVNGVLIGNDTAAVTAVDLSAKGSLLAGDGVGNPSALAVGTNGYVLTADSAEATGLKWAAAAGGASVLNDLTDVGILGSGTGWSFFKNGDTPDGAPNSGSFSGSNNLAIGYRALRLATTDTHNVAFGYQTLYNSAGGDYNFAAGYQAAYTLTTAQHNIAIGDRALRQNVTSAYNVALGREALYFVTGAANIGIGQQAGRNITSGSGNVIIGYGTGSGSIPTTGDNNITLGKFVGVPDPTADGQFVLGHCHTNPHYLLSGDYATSNQCKLGINLGATGSGNARAAVAPTATLHVKGQSASNSATAFLVTDSGDNQLVKIGDAGDNIFIGHEAGLNADTTAKSVYIGFDAGKLISTGGTSNVAVGYSALAGTAGNVNSNVAIGYNAYKSAQPGANQGVCIGYGAGDSITIGAKNICIGYDAGDNITTGENNIIIGHDIDASVSGIDHELNIGGQIIGSMTTGDKHTKFVGQVYSEAVALDVAGPDLQTGNVQSIVLTSNTTPLPNPTNIKNGATYIFILKQDGTGGRTMTFASKYKFPGGTAPTLSTGANAIDIITFVSDGTDLYGVASQNFS